MSSFETQKAEKASAAKLFFGASQFGVAGASSDPSKFGHMVYRWYLDRGMPVTPINPGSATITVWKETHTTVASPSDLAEPKTTSLSIITPPAATAKILKDAKKCGIKAVWLQPHTYDKPTLEYACREFPGAVVQGCILTEGDRWR